VRGLPEIPALTDPAPPATRASLRRAKKAPERSFLAYLGVSLSAVVFAMVLSVAVLVVIAPLVVSGQPLTVLTNSMAPKLPPGTLIVIKPTPLERIEVGDVLTYQIESGQPAVISHRVISRAVNLEGETTFITQGDNNDSPDAQPVSAVQVKGTLWYAIPYLGWVNNAINGEARSAITPPLVAILFVYAAYTVVASVRARYKRRRIHSPEHTHAQDLPHSAASTSTSSDRSESNLPH
jgi:signal peptidase